MVHPPRVQLEKAKRPTGIHRRLPIGAEPISGGGVAFRVWAPKCKTAEVVFENSATPALTLQPEASGYFAGTSPDAKTGDRYRIRLNERETLYPDPASRFQPDGPHGASEIVNPAAYRWHDAEWLGLCAAGQVLYEMHIGTFTQEGTWAAAAAELDSLKEVGVTCLEVMPVNEFPGKFGWGYDGVDQFAPFHHYGTPDDFRRFVDRAHALGLGVILDIVYNHFGPDGNYITAFSDHYFNSDHKTDWGDALNFDGEQSGPVREFFVSNAVYWITEFHLDGFRFDATQAFVDQSGHHILAEIPQQCRKAAGKRSIYLVNENEPQDTKLVRAHDTGGFGMDALWNDDFHHSAIVAVSGHREAYYTDHPGAPQEFISAAKWGYLYQGQHYSWQKQRRGTISRDLPPTAFVHFLQNHDQIANSGRGYRLHQIASPGEMRAITALLLLMPQTPMLFQGQEFATSSTFHYFADQQSELGKLIRAGRAKELSQFPSAASAEMQARLHDPTDERTFIRSKLDHAERTQPVHAEIFQLHKDLLALRRSEPTFRRTQRRGDIDGAVLGPGAFVLRYFSEDGDDRLLIVNLERDLPLHVAPEPLLAPPANRRWANVLSTEDPKYGGSGTAPLDTEQEGWFIPGRCAVVLKPMPAHRATVTTRNKFSGSTQPPLKKTEDSQHG